MFGPEFFQRALTWGPVILLSLTVHEYFHAWTAFKFGDDTAARQGRMTLNPLAHLDMMGSIVMVLSQFTFGWAKPVPVNPANLRNPRKADIWISAAGPLANLGIAIIAAMIYRLIASGMLTVPEAILQMTMGAIWINVTLAVFNMIPIFPLDGSHILGNLLPRESQEAFARFNRFAPMILILLVVTRVLWVVIGPIVTTIVRLLIG